MRFREFSLGTKMGLVASLVLSPVVIGFSVIFLSPKLNFAEWFFSQFGRPLFFTLLVLLTILFIGGICLFLSWWFVDRPLQELIRVMVDAPSSDFLLRAPVHAPDVIGRLSQSFNRLLEQITTLDKSLLLKGPFAGWVSKDILQQIHQAILNALGTL